MAMGSEIGAEGASARTGVVALLVLLWAGCGTQPAPDMHGDWELSYDDELTVELRVEGAIQRHTLPLRGGTVPWRREGAGLRLDCEGADAVICPHVLWGDSLFAEHDNTAFPRRVLLRDQERECSDAGMAGSCGRQRAAVISPDGTHLERWLGEDGAGSPTGACAPLHGSQLDARVRGQTRASGRTEATALSNGRIELVYPAACLGPRWRADPSLAESTVKLSVAFTAVKR